MFMEFREELERLVTHHLMREAEGAFTRYERHEGDILKAVLDVSRWETDCE